MINIRDYNSYIDLLPEQFKSAEKSKALLSIFLSEDQTFFDELYKLFEEGFNVDTATGYQLDLLGKLSGVYREGMTDEELREAIKLRRILDNGSGTKPDLLTYLKAFTEADTVRVFEHYPASVCLETDGINLSTDLVGKLDSASAGGVYTHSIIDCNEGTEIRPVSFDLAYENYNPIDDVFEEVATTSKLYNAIRYDFSEIYTQSLSIAGDPLMQAGEPTAQATGLTQLGDAIKSVHPPVYTIER